MIKVEKEKKFKKEYIPVIIAVIILAALIAILVVSIFYEDNTIYEEVPTTYSDTSDLAIDKTSSKCTSGELDEIIKSASKITAEYDAVEKEIPNDNLTEDEVFEGEDLVDAKIVTDITLKNITDDVYILVKNDYNDNVRKITYKDTQEGTFIFEGETNQEIVKYNVEIYSNKYNCVDELIRNMTLETKIFNFYSTMLFCAVHPGYDKCEEFVDEKYTFQEFNAGTSTYVEKHGEEDQENLVDIQIENAGVDVETLKEKTFVDRILENKELMIISGIIISSGVVVIILIKVLRRD